MPLFVLTVLALAAAVVLIVVRGCGRGDQDGTVD